MSYVKTDPQPPGLSAGETSVTLDTGALVAASVSMQPQTNNAPSFVEAIARQVSANGGSVLDANGAIVAVVYRHSPTPDEANDPTTLAAIQKDCLMAVLGEPLTGPLSDPVHAGAVANCSIRNRIAALAAAGPVNVAALL